MKLLITGICGFVGNTLALALRESLENVEIVGVDNLSRAGSELNRQTLASAGIRVRHVDIRCASDFESLPRVDWVIDAAANPSVLAGADGRTSSRQLLEHNLIGTINMLEYCKQHKAGFILLSTSRVYSIKALAGLPMVEDGDRFSLAGGDAPGCVSPQGVGEDFSTANPLSLYGASKLASETLALEYGTAFDFPVWINRCGVLAGAGQFGHAEQGIYSFWIHSWLARRPLRYIGFGGSGRQVRDCLHPRDLVGLLLRQMDTSPSDKYQICNVSGGEANSISLAELSAWCAERLGIHDVGADHQERQYDVPWLILDPQRASSIWGWQVETPVRSVLEEIALFAEKNPGWLDVSQPV